MSTGHPDAQDGQAPQLARVPGLGLLWAGIGLIGLLLTGFLLVGLVLPGTWEVRREAELQASPAEVYPLLADLDAWEAWTHWPELSGFESGANTGVGATRAWDDGNYGQGRLTVTSLLPDSHVGYEVEVDGSMRFEGTLVLTRTEQGGTALIWTERGDFGRNPLMGYTARSMDRLQGREMEKSLARLATAASDRAGQRE